MNPREQWIMAAIGAGVAVYLFGINALYLLAVAAVIFLITRRR